MPISRSIITSNQTTRTPTSFPKICTIESECNHIRSCYLTSLSSFTSLLPSAVPGRSILPISSPTVEIPLFRPGRWNLEPVVVVVVVVDGGAESELSPNLEKNPFLFTCLFSSFSPTSSNPSSAVGGCLSNRRSFIADRGSRGILAESRLWRPAAS